MVCVLVTLNNEFITLLLLYSMGAVAECHWSVSQWWRVGTDMLGAESSSWARLRMLPVAIIIGRSWGWGWPSSRPSM